jgi:hypothetical protein
MEAASQFNSLREVRRELRRLPRERRREVASSIRDGRAVSDPRDAPLAAAWAERLVLLATRVPGWLMPLSRRPQGWRARVWLLHLTLVVAAVIYAYYELWNVLSGLWRWVLLGWLIYSALTLPLTIRTMRRTFHTYWNAPTAAEKNREVAK